MTGAYTIINIAINCLRCVNWNGSEHQQKGKMDHDYGVALLQSSFSPNIKIFAFDPETSQIPKFMET